MQKLRRFSLPHSHSKSSILTIALIAILCGAIIVQPAFAATNTFSGGGVTIPASGFGSPYPSTISVSGLTGTVLDVDVTISGLIHTNPDDLDVLLVGPGGQTVMLMSDAGGATDVNSPGINLTFNQSSLLAVPNTSILFGSGSFRPANHNGGDSDTFPAPAPASPYGTTLNDFDGVNPNGTWSLYIVDDTATNSGSISGWSLTITTGVAPTITSPDYVVVPPGSSGTFMTLTATGDPDIFVWLCDGPAIYIGCFPALGADNRLGSLLPLNTPGAYPIEVEARNGVTPFATQNFTLYVGVAPAITSAASVNVDVGDTFSHTFTATGNPAPTLSYVTGTLPAGVSLIGNVLSGTPTEPGTYTIDVTASNGIPSDATQTFTLTVTGETPQITSTDSVTVTNGDTFSHTFTATGNPAPTLSYVVGTLPSGVTLVGDVLSGTPSVPGVYTIDVTATNGVTPDATQTFTLTVNGDAPVITSANTLTVINGDAFTHTFTATGNPIPTLSYVVGTLPSGVSLVGDVLSGTPAGPGVYTIDVTATNGVTPDATQTFTLTVQGGAPLITSVATLHMEQESYIAHTFAATGNPDPTVTYTDVNLPPGLTLTGDTISGYAHLSGTYGVTVTATNGVAPDAVQHFVLIVGALPEPPPLPFAEDVNFLETTAVRTGVPSNVFDTILVRIMYQYGSPTQWLGGDMYNLGNIGIQGVVDMGVWQAIDLSGANGATYFEGGATFCLHGEGTLIWMSAANTPRVAEIIGSYTVPEFPGYTCATLFEPGTLVLVNGNAG